MTTRGTMNIFYKKLRTIWDHQVIVLQEQLTERFPDQYLSFFKQARTDLASSFSQLEDLNSLYLGPEPTPPLLTIRFFASAFGQLYESHLKNRELQNNALLENVVY